jgi:hypothetical protein
MTPRALGSRFRISLGAWAFIGVSLCCPAQVRGLVMDWPHIYRRISLLPCAGTGLWDGLTARLSAYLFVALRRYGALRWTDRMFIGVSLCCPAQVRALRWTDRMFKLCLQMCKRNKFALLFFYVPGDQDDRSVAQVLRMGPPSHLLSLCGRGTKRCHRLHLFMNVAQQLYSN